MSGWFSAQEVEVRRLERCDRRIERVLAGGPMWSESELSYLVEDVRRAFARSFGEIDHDATVTTDDIVVATGFWPSAGDRALDRAQDITARAERERYYRTRDFGLQRAAKIIAREGARAARVEADRFRREQREYERAAEDALGALEEIAFYDRTSTVGGAS
jgi:hypothetical protein